MSASNESEAKTKKILMVGESNSSLVVSYYLLQNPVFKEGDYQLYLVYSQSPLKLMSHQWKTWLLQDPCRNSWYQMHAYKYTLSKFIAKF